MDVLRTGGCCALPVTDSVGSAKPSALAVHAEEVRHDPAAVEQRVKPKFDSSSKKEQELHEVAIGMTRFGTTIFCNPIATTRLQAAPAAAA
jgi:hypothetical protein